MSHLVQVDVTIFYRGPKAHKYRLDKDVPVGVLLSDLNEFKCPHPKRSTIVVQSPGTVQFSWTCPANSPLVLTQVKKLQPEGNAEYGQLIRKLSITSIQVVIKPMNEAMNVKSEEEWGTPLIERMKGPSDAVSLTSSLPSSPPPPFSSRIGPSPSQPRVQVKPEPQEPNLPKMSHRLPPAPVPIPIPIPHPPFPPTLPPKIPIESSLNPNSLPLKRNRSNGESSGHTTSAPRPVQRRRINPEEVSAHRRALAEIRREMTELREREVLLVDTLSYLDPSSVTSSDLELVRNRGELVKLEAQVREERAQRRRAEEALEDVRRECRAPFIVPQILDAFMLVSELTTRAIMSQAETDHGGGPSGLSGHVRDT